MGKSKGFEECYRSAIKLGVILANVTQGVFFAEFVSG